MARFAVHCPDVKLEISADDRPIDFVSDQRCGH